MHIFCLLLCAFEALPYVCCKLPFVSINCPTCFSLHKATIFYNTVFSASILKIWWEIFPTFNVGKCDATVAKVP